MGGRAAIILVMGFGFVFGYVAIRINELESWAVDNTARYYETTSAHNLASAGANAGLSKLYQLNGIWGRSTDTMLATQTFSAGQLGPGRYTVMYGPSGTGSRLMSTSVLTTGNGTLRDTVRIVFAKVDSFDILGLMQGFRGNDDTWIKYDSMWGRVHFNGRVGVKGSPVFNDKVTLSKGWDPPPGTSINQVICLNGYETGVNTLPLPTLTDTSDTFPCADTTLIGDFSFNLSDTVGVPNTGFFRIRSGLHNFTGGGSIDPYFYNVPSTRQGVIVVRGNASVKGRINGHLTIAATRKIYIDDDLTYAVNPQTDPASNDILALVAMDDIILYNQPAGSSGRTWITQAVMVSLGGTIAAENRPNNWWAVFRNYGGLITKDRFNIAQYSGAGGGSTPYLQGGFYRRFRWDTRLGPPRRLRPPCTPIPDNVPTGLQIVNWWENVRIPEY